MCATEKAGRMGCASFECARLGPEIVLLLVFTSHHTKHDDGVALQRPWAESAVRARRQDGAQCAVATKGRAGFSLLECAAD